VLGVGVVLGVVVAACVYAATGDGFSVAGASNDLLAYLGVFGLIALDGVVPVFPGETTLNAAATAAVQGTCDLLPVIVMGALGAIVGDHPCAGTARVCRLTPSLRCRRRR
jgi:hypothetical protein